MSVTNRTNIIAAIILANLVVGIAVLIEPFPIYNRTVTYSFTTPSHTVNVSAPVPYAPANITTWQDAKHWLETHPDGCTRTNYHNETGTSGAIYWTEYCPGSTQIVTDTGPGTVATFIADNTGFDIWAWTHDVNWYQIVSWTIEGVLMVVYGTIFALIALALYALVRKR